MNIMFQMLVRLQELIERKQDLNADIEQILLDLEKLYGEVDEVGTSQVHGFGGGF